MKKKVIAAGHICIDITPVFPDEKVEKLGDILSPGKLLNVGSADVHTGGSVANTGMCMHKLGADVSLMGKIGNDEFGNMVLGILKEYGLDSGMIVSDTSTTSYSVVLAVPGIDRIFLHHPGANHDFHCSDIRKDLLKEAVLFHFGYPPLMESMYREEGKELTEMFRMVAGEGVVTSLDMAAVDEKTEAGKADWEKILRNTLPFVDLFFPSIEELLYMLDRKRYTELQKKASGGDIIDVLSIENDVKLLAEKLIDMGVGIAVIKCGVKGMYYKTGNADAMARLREKSGRKLEGFENQEGMEKSYVPARVRSATGAGDTSIGAFLCAVLSDRPLLQCMHLAAGTGASCVEEYDALSGLRSFEELEKKIAEGWQKQQ